MDEKYSFLEQDQATRSMIESSLYRCGKSGLSPYAKKLPDVTQDDIARCKKHVSGHIHLMRKSSPAYYKKITETLAAHDACLFYIFTNFDIFGRYGNQPLKDELKAKNICLGGNLSESAIGTNAAVMASRSPKGVWVVGENHYSDALNPYACYAFQIHGRYGRSGYIMLVTHKENLTPGIRSLFEFIESTECIITAGLVTEDVIIKDTMMRNKYSKKQTDNIVVIVDNFGIVTYANDGFYDVFKADAMSTINKELVQLVPELSSTLNSISTGKQITAKRVEFARSGNGDDAYFVDCMPINNNSLPLGMLITAYKSKPQDAGGDNQGNSAKYSFNDLLGVADNFTQLKRFAERIAATVSPVLIQGESGTGKELFAHAIHCACTRQNKPFVAINCSAIPRELIGSELFGYVGGSFTGASRTGAKGKFELADGGTLFLDEIGEMPLEMQSVLLRVLEENAVTRIGGTKPIPIDVRLITATNRDLQSYIAEGKFRADLYYRLNVINLNMIPLRCRREDIPVLSDAFIKRYSRKSGVHINGITPEAQRALIEYNWPGNIRELRNVIERGVIVSDSGYIELRNLPPNITRMEPVDAVNPDGDESGADTTLSSRFVRQRHELAVKLMSEHKGNKSKVAKEMGISRSTLYRILKDDQE